MAKLRAATMLAKQNRMADARRYLADLPAVTIEQRIQVRQAEAQLLRDAGDNAERLRGADEGACRAARTNPIFCTTSRWSPKSSTRSTSSESQLTQLIALNPDNAQALNALGYTLVDRTKRTAEGAALIERAHKLDPKDPFILDSMGWAQFRHGQSRRRRDLSEARARPSARTRRSRRISAKCCGRRASARARGKCGSRS